MRKFLALLLALCLTPAFALAQPHTPYDCGLMPGYQTLTEKQQAILDLAYAAAVRGLTEVTLPPDTSFDDAHAAMNVLINDCPELCALDSDYSITYYQRAPEVACGVELRYKRSIDTQTELLARARMLAAQAQGDAWDRALFLHDAVVGMTSYDLSAPAQTTAYGALVDGRAGCEGYAKALILLYRLAGIPSSLVWGLAMEEDTLTRHGWLVANVGGSYVYTDPTWNDQEEAGLNSHWYYNLSLEDMSLDHVAQGWFILPESGDEDLTWHAANGLVVPDEGGEEIIHRALRAMVEEKTAVNLRFEDAQDAAEFLDTLDMQLDIYDEKNPDAPFTGRFGVAASPVQGCVAILAME